MQIDLWHVILLGLAFILIACFRYISMVGAYYLVVYKLFKNRLKRFKINQEFPEKEMVVQESKWALLNKINFGFIGVGTFYLYKEGHLKVYHDLDEYGLWYAILIVPVTLVLLDTYFYWIHYFMHHPKYSKKSHHYVHHLFKNVSPWSAFSVHPFEGFVEILSRPLLLLLIPLHPYSIIAFLIITFALNVIGHSGYEFFQSNYPRTPLLNLGSSATFHYLHHRDSRYNFGLFLNVWDRIMGTMHPDYEAFYDKVIENRRNFNKVKNGNTENSYYDQKPINIS
ncbi:MAG: sterol desaturase [Halobacteriovoraceae bacterium]|nr:sterol desaturase [Halobacteriovoraceae bacterium]